MVKVAAASSQQKPKATKLKIPERFYEKSDAWGFKSSLRLLGVPLLWIFLLPYLYKLNFWLPILVICPFGIAISKTTLLVHEAVHDTLFKTKSLNEFFGRLGGWWTVVDFFAFVSLHKKHHAYVGLDDDPQLLDYGALEHANRKQLAWHLLRPLLGWNIKHMFTLLKERMKMEQDWQTSVQEFIGIILVQGGFFLLATDFGKYPWLALIFPIAALTVGMFMSQVRGFCEHIPLPGENAEMRLRSHDSNCIERPFLHYMNYNFHGEHHRYPRIPSRNLPAFAQWLTEQGVEIEHSPSYLATLYNRWKACAS